MRTIREFGTSALVALLSLGLLGSPGAAASQMVGGAGRLPFAPGEAAIYQVKLGGVAVGRGAMRVLGVETVDGHPTFHTRMEISGGIPLARVEDRYDSWIDTDGLFSRRFHQNIKEVRYKRERRYDFFPERRSFRRTDNGETGELPTDRPLDDISFLYYARTLPLRVGETYTLNRYFKGDGNPVVLRVLRKETVRVPAGTFETVVVRPIIRTKGLFGEGGEAEVYFTDDARRIPVLVRSRVPIVGFLSMHLTEYKPGTTVGSAARS